MPKMNLLPYLVPFLCFLGLVLFLRKADAENIPIPLFSLPTLPEIPSIPKLKQAILAVENTSWTKAGAADEVTSYQILPSVWRQWSFMPIEEARKDTPEARAEAELVVSKQLAWIRKCLEKQNYEPNVYSMALVWKAGFGRFSEYKTRAVDRDYAKRCLNLYHAK